MAFGGLPTPPPPPDAAARAGETNTPWIEGVSGTFAGIALLAVALRIYTRVTVAKTAGWDDYAMIFSGVMCLVQQVCFGVAGHYGVGRHYWIPTVEEESNQILATFLQGAVGLIPSLAALKISISISLLRLSPGKWFRRVMYFLIVFVVCTAIFGVFTVVFFCNPVRRYWDSNAKGTCYSIPLYIDFGVTHTALNIFTDIAFATSPIPVIWPLQMKRTTRIYLIGVFSLGYVAVAMGIVRAVYQLAFGGNPDSAFLQSIQFWGSLQLDTGIIAACVPTLKPLLGRWLNLGSTNKYYGGPGSGGPSGGRRRTGYIVQNTPVGPEFELDESRPHFSHGRSNYHASINGTKTMSDPYDKSGSLGERSGSEEMILPEETNKGILRTTQVTIER